MVQKYPVGSHRKLGRQAHRVTSSPNLRKVHRVSRLKPRLSLYCTFSELRYQLHPFQAHGRRMCRSFHLLSLVIALATLVSPHSLQKFGENTRSISHCRTQLRGSGQQDHGSKRRAETVTYLRRDLINTQQGHRNVRIRDLSDILHHNHEFTREAVRENEDDVLLFADHTSYTLQGEMIEGPYYVNGELIRSNISQGQEGVPLFLDIQLIDTSTCHPIADAFVDIWQANATGVYSGVIGLDNGNFEDKSNLNTNFLRGVQQTNSNGVVQFQTIFPGHYEGTHVTRAQDLRLGTVLYDFILSSVIVV